MLLPGKLLSSEAGEVVGSVLPWYSKPRVISTAGVLTPSMLPNEMVIFSVLFKRLTQNAFLKAEEEVKLKEPFRHMSSN